MSARTTDYETEPVPFSACVFCVKPDSVRFSPDIEPLVRLLEETPRDRLIEEMAGRVRRGLSYQEVLATLFLAGVRNVQPRPHVGFKFHAVTTKPNQSRFLRPSRILIRLTTWIRYAFT